MTPCRPSGWVEVDEGLYEIGHEGDGFCFDNELPRHRHFLERYALADRLVTNGEYQAFMADGGYERPELWLSLGWATREQHHWTSPFYWEPRDGRWMTYTLGGMREVDPAEPICHVSYFEADAYRAVGRRAPAHGAGVGGGGAERAGAGQLCRHGPLPSRAVPA